MIDLQPDLELTTAQAERVLEVWQGGPVACTGIQRMKGGMVNTVLRLEFDRPPHRAVIKLHGNNGDRFASEARSLEYLRSETACPVPAVYQQDSSAQLIPYRFLLLEDIPGVSLEGLDLEPEMRADIEAQLAAVLGELHHHVGTRWGGFGTPEASGDWADVFAGRLADVRAHPPVAKRLAADVLAQVDEAIDLAGSTLRDSGAPTLIHGDVWDGNMIVHPDDGRWRLAGLLDPNLQYADVELELAYLEVFDQSREAFFTTYLDQHTLRRGYEERRLFYWLHTALLHVALFGDQFFCDFTADTAARIVEAIGSDQNALRPVTGRQDPTDTD